MLDISPTIATGTFDVVISTQAEFEALLTSPTWFDAVSICFVGDGGTLKFTKSDGTGILIPQTVKQLQGMNGATIDVLNFKYHKDDNKAALWYKPIPGHNGYSISNMTVNCVAIDTSHAVAFANCVNLNECVCDTYTGSFVHSAYGYRDCEHLCNCVAANIIGAITLGYSGCSYLINCVTLNAQCTDGSYCFRYCSIMSGCYGNCPSAGRNKVYIFDQCNKLTNCIAKGSLPPPGASGHSSVVGFNECYELTNCSGDTSAVGAAAASVAFADCIQLMNCTGIALGGKSSAIGFMGCTQLTNCQGTGVDDPDPGTMHIPSGYGFKSCSYLNGCKQGDTPSTTAFLGGTNTNVDHSLLWLNKK